MKKVIIILLFFLAILNLNSSAQRIYLPETESHGNTLNLGAGYGGYSGYSSHAGLVLPVYTINYEFAVLNDVTLAPFATLFSYRNEKEHYSETIIPMGVKGTLYLDQLLKGRSRWDLYFSGSIGYSLINSSWDEGFSGETAYSDVTPLFLDLNIGTEYHINNRIGIFLELSTGVCTAGLSFRRF